MEMILSKKGVPTPVLIDADVFHKIKHKKWFINNKGYAAGTNQGKYILLHRFILNLQPGDKICVDHKNHNRLDNRLKNLRTCSFAENLKNQRIYKNNASGFKGVNRRLRSDGSYSFRARIRNNGVLVQLGTYNTAEEAALAYDKKAVELFGDFAHQNFPPGKMVG